VKKLINRVEIKRVISRLLISRYRYCYQLYWRYFSYAVSKLVSAILFHLFVGIFDTDTLVTRCTSWLCQKKTTL